jgi:hypothetical protein
MSKLKYSWPGLLFLSIYGFAGIAASHADPSIQILSVPDYGSVGDLQGVVSGVNVQDYEVATYFHVEGFGWSTEQNLGVRTVPLNANGTFSVPILGIRSDTRATIFATELVPKGYTPAQIIQDGRIPAGLPSVAMDFKQRYSRTTTFGGYQWGVKESPGGAGPGANAFSNLPQDVHVDNQGLHLTVNHHDNRWWATEIINTKPLGYGTYVVQTNSRVGQLDPMVAFGAFTWDAFGDDTVGPTPNRELDFEDARFGFAADPTSSQFVVQPFNAPNQLVRYTLPDLSADPALTRIMVWTPTGIRFIAVRGHHTADDFDPQDVIAEWLYTGSIPDPGRAAFRFNLWPSNVVVGGTVPEPSSGLAQEVIVSGFFFTPVPELSSWISLATGLAALFVWTGIRRRGSCGAAAG